MLQSGKNCYSYLKDHNSYAPMTIQGDRILLSAFQKGGGLSVTSDKDALLFPVCILYKVLAEAPRKISPLAPTNLFFYIKERDLYLPKNKRKSLDKKYKRKS